MRFMLITASNQLPTANRAKTAVIDIISLACNVPRLFIAICECVCVCVWSVCGVCCVCAFGILSSAEALAQLALLYQRHLVHFSHLVLCDICLSDTFVSFVGPSRSICILPLIWQMLSLSLPCDSCQRLTQQQQQHHFISLWRSDDDDDDDDQRRRAHIQHDFYEGIRIKIVYCVYLLQTSIKKRPKWKE